MSYNLHFVMHPLGVVFDRATLEELDGEGRCVITDHGAFVLFNIYFPRACMEEVERYSFKVRFNELVKVCL